MQHRAVANLQSESAAAAGLGNYSRTPELRVSHKLAERKRRSEMKDLFDDLNKAVPNNGGTKASKWEILSKGTQPSYSFLWLVLTNAQQSNTSVTCKTRMRLLWKICAAWHAMPTMCVKHTRRMKCSRMSCVSCIQTCNASTRTHPTSTALTRSN